MIDTADADTQNRLEVLKMNTLSFVDWMRLVDSYLIQLCGVSSDCLPDYDYARSWAANMRPLSVAKRAIKAAKEY